ncbi:uncharacterized protein TNCV_2222501 [Trichonephila clavipes]|nr:uncharacterized protein TNCV_2222501 [Trichonephila clavipes]
MDLISSRYRKPKGRPTKRRNMLAENSKKRWQKFSKTVDEKTVIVKKKMLKMSRQAGREAHVKVDASLKNQEIIDVSVSYDGTWQKRGHISNLGLGIIIDILSGLVLDFEVLSKYTVIIV